MVCKEQADLMNPAFPEAIHSSLDFFKTMKVDSGCFPPFLFPTAKHAQRSYTFINVVVSCLWRIECNITFSTKTNRQISNDHHSFFGLFVFPFLNDENSKTKIVMIIKRIGTC